MELTELKVVKAYTDQREEQYLVQFLMTLRDDFEGLRGSILHRNPIPSVDSVFNELLAEEIRLKTDTTVTPDTDIPLVSTATQEPPVTVDPLPPCYPSHDYKSTQLPDFVYSTYSAFLASFLTSIHSLSEPSSYKEAFRDDMDGINDLKLQLAKQFEMKDLGTLCYFLGIEVSYSTRGHLLSLEDSPLELNVKYAPSNGVPLPDPTLCRTLVGSLVYLTITRPNIAYVVSQFIVSPTIVYWATVLRICRYLWGIQFHTLFVPSSSPLDLRAYSDADWAATPHIISLLQYFVSFLEIILFLGRVRNKILSLVLLQKLSIVL
ncbi:hypothetical protein KIW84_060581 [Lathyrus oleraceus]|uniref:Mitochondrial protein n=1 Tax=Pisum sativum TaxID=3888 RepID=A0A9D5A160_PEA|nr:hypothetical protein KIW84_060581 [Pisum sativum]